MHRTSFLAIIFASLLAGCASAPERQSAGEYFDDAVITTKVKTVLLKDRGLDGLDIAVETWNGIVQLSGFVDSRDDMRRAVELAEGVAGVRDVRNDMRVKPRR